MTLDLSTLGPEVKQVSCLLDIGLLLSVFTFIVLINLNVVLFLDDFLLGGDGGGVGARGGVGIFTDDGAERLKFENVLFE